MEVSVALICTLNSAPELEQCLKGKQILLFEENAETLTFRALATTRRPDLWEAMSDFAPVIWQGKVSRKTLTLQGLAASDIFDYLEVFLPLLAQLGATGIEAQLFCDEWEEEAEIVLIEAEGRVIRKPEKRKKRKESAATKKANALNALASRFAEAIALEQIDIMKELLTQGACVDQFSPDYYPPLCGAIINNARKSFDFLIEQGADVNANPGKDSDFIPLLTACRSEDCEIYVELLLKAGANPRIRSDRHTGALYHNIAGAKPSLKVLTLLLDHKAPIHTIRSEDCSAIHIAAHLKNASFLQLLLDRGADPSYSANGRTYPPIIHAIREGRLQNVQLLLSAGADVNFVLYNASPRDIASECAKSPGYNVSKDVAEQILALIESAGGKSAKGLIQQDV